jgi:hypothetical protein
MRFTARRNYTNNFGAVGALCKVYSLLLYIRMYICTCAEAKLQAQRPAGTTTPREGGTTAACHTKLRDTKSTGGHAVGLRETPEEPTGTLVIQETPEGPEGTRGDRERHQGDQRAHGGHNRHQEDRRGIMGMRSGPQGQKEKDPTTTITSKRTLFSLGGMAVAYSRF